MLYCSSHVEICLVTPIPSYCAYSASLAKNAPISILQLKNFNLPFKIVIRLHPSVKFPWISPWIFYTFPNN